jgi:hypothetical protein
MTKKEFERRQHQQQTLKALGFTADEAEQLRRISNTLQRWFDNECQDAETGYIERDQNGDGPPYFVRHVYGHGTRPDRVVRRRIPDREAGAKRRLAAIIDRRNARQYNPNSPTKIGTGPMDQGAVIPYIQTDPRGAALYILRPGDVPAGCDAGGYYSRGVCVY